MHLLSVAERYIRKNKVSATRVGRESVGDPRLIFDMRNGRNLGAKIESRLSAYLMRDAGDAG